MKTQIIIEIPFYRDSPQYNAAIKKVVENISVENMIEVARKIDKHGSDSLNQKLSKGLNFI